MRKGEPPATAGELLDGYLNELPEGISRDVIPAIEGGQGLKRDHGAGRRCEATVRPGRCARGRIVPRCHLGVRQGTCTEAVGSDRSARMMAAASVQRPTGKVT